MSNDEITMEQLAEMVQKGFEQTSAEIKSVDSRVSSLDDKVSTLDDKVSTLDGKVSKLENGLRELKEEVFELKGSVEYGFRSVNDKLDDLKESLGEPAVHRNEHDDLVSRVKYVETRLGVESGK